MIQSPSTKSVSVGQTVSLSCTASTGVDDDLSWYLQKPGQPHKLLFYKISTRSFQQQWIWTGVHSNNQRISSRRCRRLLLHGSICRPPHTVTESRTKTSLRLAAAVTLCKRFWCAPLLTLTLAQSPKAQPQLVGTYGFSSSLKGELKLRFSCPSQLVCSLFAAPDVQSCTQSCMLR